jgi:predicted Rossmann fold nucleotide-binding protein DprA/Smf involved in DNA uptake
MKPIKSAKVAVVGGRKFKNYVLMKQVLDQYNEKHGISMIISGGAPGADTLAEKYAHQRQIDLTVFMAKWNEEGKRAGPRRNVRMANIADIAIAFPDPNSKGTWHMIKTMEKYKKPVYVIEED